MPPRKKTASSIEHGEEGLIIHRSNRGFFGHVHSWTSYISDDLNNSNHKHYRLSKLFVIFHCLRNAFFWQSLVPFTFLILAVLNGTEVLNVFEPNTAGLPLQFNVSISSSNNNETTSAAVRRTSCAWSHTGAAAVLLLLSALSATVIPRVVSPLLFSERGHRSDLRLPIDIINKRLLVPFGATASTSSAYTAAANNNNDGTALADNDDGDGQDTSAIVETPSAAAVDVTRQESTFSNANPRDTGDDEDYGATSTANHRSSSSKSRNSLSLIKEHVPFRRVPLTPKAIGAFFMILAHPFVHLILLFSNSGLSIFPRSVQLHPHGQWWSPLAVISSWFTFDFTRSLSDSEVACALSRTYYWIITMPVHIVFLLVVFTILWAPAQMEQMMFKQAYKKTFRWAVIWTVALVCFPLWNRVLFTGFGCRIVERDVVTMMTSQSDDNNVTTTTTVTAATSATTAIASNDTTRTMEIVAVTLLCPTTDCASSTHTSYSGSGFFIFLLTFPGLLVAHTQLRRLSIVPRLSQGEKTKPLPRIDGIHLYLLLLNRFILSAMSGVAGDIPSLAIAAVVFDSASLLFTWRAPCFSNVFVLNHWWRRWTVPASISIALGYAVWAVTVHRSMADAVATGAVVSDAVVRLGLIIEIAVASVVAILFVSAVISHRAEQASITPPGINGGGASYYSNGLLASIFHLPKSGQPLAAAASNSSSPSPTTTNRTGAIGEAVESKYSPANNQNNNGNSSPSPNPRRGNNDDDDDGYDSDADAALNGDDEEPDVEHFSKSASMRARFRMREISLHDEPTELFPAAPAAERRDPDDNNADLASVASGITFE